MNLRISESPAPYPTLFISEHALINNLSLFRKISNNRKILIPVKANAYGCGIQTLLPFFIDHKIDYLGVANPGEGRLLRELGWERPILLLGGFFPENIREIIDFHLTASITDSWQIKQLNQYASNSRRKLSVHMKLDLGMGRIGILPEDLPEVIEQFKKSDRIQINGIFTHFPKAERPNQPETIRQINDFIQYSEIITESLKLNRDQVLLHTANSYATIHYPESHFDMIRPGILFYGYFHTEKDRQELYKDFPFEGAVRLSAQPVSLRKLRKGAKISYGSTYTVPHDDFEVGVFPLGYADGIPRALSGQNIHFGPHPLLGRVTMDQIIIGGITTKKELDILGGLGLPIEKAGDLSSSFSYEVLCGLGHRLRRRLI